MATQFAQDVLNKKKGKKTMNDLDIILYEYQTKFGELLKIVDKISDDSNPSFIKKEIDKFKKHWKIDEL